MSEENKPTTMPLDSAISNLKALADGTVRYGETIPTDAVDQSIVSVLDELDKARLDTQCAKFDTDQFAELSGDLEAMVANLRSELASLQAKLPTTADGVMVVPGDQVITPSGHAIRLWSRNYWSEYAIVHHAETNKPECFRVQDCYSTPAAAQAARDQNQSAQ